MFAFVTLITSDSYEPGALVLVRILEKVSSIQVVVMYTETVSQHVIDHLSLFARMVKVEVLKSGDMENLSLLNRPDLETTFTKIQAWKLTEYEKIVYLDADTMPLTNIDDLFEYPELSAAPDCGWPDCFNSGVIVLCPSDETYQKLKNFAQNQRSFDGADQGLLNSFFPLWNRIPFVYNVTPSTVYTYKPALNNFKEKIKLIHFAGPNKPWNTSDFDSDVEEFVSRWLSVYNEQQEQQNSIPHFNHFETKQENHAPPPGIHPGRYSWPEEEFTSSLKSKLKSLDLVFHGKTPEKKCVSMLTKAKPMPIVKEELKVYKPTRNFSVMFHVGLAVAAAILVVQVIPRIF